jgi:1-acyl-sn-glycerol-3-phosphate acyltransferase
MDPSRPLATAPEPHRPGSLRIALATAAVVVFGVPGTLILALLAVLASAVTPRGRGMLFFARVWGRCLLAAGGVRVETEVAPELAAAPPRGSFVFLANHQSYYDIPVLLSTLPRPVLFAAKESLFRIPVFGWSLAAGGFIPVDRGNPAQGREVFARAAKRLQGGSSVLFFPEGTRSRDGQLGPFHRGGFLLALRAGLPIVPVGIEGAQEVLPRARWTIHPATVRVRFGAPVDPSAYGIRGRGELVAAVRRRIVELARLPAEDAAIAGEATVEGPRGS